MKLVTPDRRFSETLALKRVNNLLWVLVATLTLFIILGGLK
jgi:hypothetical protein